MSGAEIRGRPLLHTDEAERILREEAEEALRQAADVAEREWQERVHRDVHVRISRTGERLEAELGAADDPRVIEPRRAKALAFRIGGRLVFRRRVRGVDPSDFADEAAAAVRPSVERILADGGSRAAARLRRGR